jgi:hypothetical protein
MTPLKMLNYFILQWFFIRLTKCTVQNDEGKINSWYSIMYFVLPLSGWGSDFKYIWKRELLRVS